MIIAMNIIYKYISIVILLAISNVSMAQFPFNGFSIEEITIPPSEVATIQTTTGSAGAPRCWRVYICMEDPNWELQAIYGDSTYAWILNLATPGSVFYQNPLNGGPIAKSINPAFFPFFPESQYDSWFAIGIDNNSSQTEMITGNTNPFTTFETGTGFIVNDFIGSLLFGTWGPPNSEGRADIDNKLLIAQFTTDDIFTAILNFQFRRLNADGSIYLPVETIKITGQILDGTPGSEPDLCPIVFLPIDLVSFNATPYEDIVNLRWETASEKNSERFIVERSSDLIHYHEIIEMPANGFSDNTIIYSNSDRDPLAGTSYYRLKQIDTNGDYTYSNVVPVKFESNQDVSIYPNPTNHNAFLKGDLDEVTRLEVSNSAGSIVYAVQMTDDQRELNLSEMDLESGIYFVKFTFKDGTTQSKRLVKN